MYGIGILKGLGVTFKHFVETFVDDIQYLGRKGDMATFQHKQSLANRGLVTVEYPDEKIAVPERFRFVPFLVTYNHDDPEYPDKDWCTSCGICAKVCPPQCIWIVRGTDPKTGRPKPEPENFYIDIDICMNCGYCAEYCPFDAIKMDHNYELASYDRTSNHIFDHDKLSKELRYWQTIAPTTAAEEQAARGGYDHSDVQKTRKKAGLEPSRVGPYSDKPAAVAEAVAAEAAPVAQASAPAAAAAAQVAVPGAATTADGKPIVRRRGAGVKAPSAGGEGAAPAAPSAATPKPSVAPAPAASDAPPAAAAAAPKKVDVAPEPPTANAAPPASQAASGMIQRGPKRVIDPNNPGPVVRRRNPPPAGK